MCLRDSSRPLAGSVRAICILLMAGCLGNRVRPPADPPPAPAGGLTVTLVWDADVDLDLYVTDPAWETFYYGRPGRVLAADARCAGGRAARRWERARWTRPPSGRYRVGVDYPSGCAGEPAAVPFRVLVCAEGRRRETSGVVRLRERQPAVLELSIP